MACTAICGCVARAWLLWRHCRQSVPCVKPTWMLPVGELITRQTKQCHLRRPIWRLEHREKRQLWSGNGRSRHAEDGARYTDDNDCQIVAVASLPAAALSPSRTATTAVMAMTSAMYGRPPGASATGLQPRWRHDNSSIANLWVKTPGSTADCSQSG